MYLTRNEVGNSGSTFLLKDETRKLMISFTAELLEDSDALTMRISISAKRREEATPQSRIKREANHVSIQRRRAIGSAVPAEGS